MEWSAHRAGMLFHASLVNIIPKNNKNVALTSVGSLKNGNVRLLILAKRLGSTAGSEQLGKHVTRQAAGVALVKSVTDRNEPQVLLRKKFARAFDNFFVPHLSSPHNAWLRWTRHVRPSRIPL